MDKVQKYNSFNRRILLWNLLPALVSAVLTIHKQMADRFLSFIADYVLHNTCCNLRLHATKKNSCEEVMKY